MKRQNISQTVFFRYNPPPQSSRIHITRSHFETFFSEVGPVKKCSVIRDRRQRRRDDDDDDNADKEGGGDDGPSMRNVRGYGFCRFTTQEDALEAVKNLNGRSLEGMSVKVTVELGSGSAGGKNTTSTSNTNNQNDTSTDSTTNTTSGTTPKEDADEAYRILQKKKNTSRVIVRNLSFYATERDVRKTMTERFGRVVDVHLPLVPNYRKDRDGDGDGGSGSGGKNKRRAQHRGFAFVTFDQVESARRAVRSCSGEEDGGEGEVLIKKRAVAIDMSVPKVQHKVLQKERKEEEEKEEMEKEDGDSDSDDDNDDEDGSGDDESGSENDESGSDNDGSDSDDSSSSSSSTSTTSSSSSNAKPTETHHDPAKKPQYSLFLRNLPFDATRHDVFQTFYRRTAWYGIRKLRKRGRMPEGFGRESYRR